LGGVYFGFSSNFLDFFEFTQNSKDFEKLFCIFIKISLQTSHFEPYSNELNFEGENFCILLPYRRNFVTAMGTDPVRFFNRIQKSGILSNFKGQYCNLDPIFMVFCN
jgi:hypothetical protein